MALDSDGDADGSSGSDGRSGSDDRSNPGGGSGVSERVRAAWARVRAAWARVGRRARRVERRELAEFGRWIEDTDNLVHLSVLVIVPLLVAAVTALSNAVDLFSFLLFPPLASGTYTLFADPEGRYADPVRFVVGLTAGAGCGWAALRLIDLGVPGAGSAVSPAAAAFSILLAGGVTWGLDVEEPSAFSAALLVLAAPARAELYVLFTLVGSTLVAAAFSLWRTAFYERRATLLYGTTRADDHVLVPMRGEHARATAAFGATLAAAHDAGKVVLLDVVDEGETAAAAESDDPAAVEAAERVTETAAADLEAHADRVRRRFGVPCEVVVAAGDPRATLRRTVRETGADLIVTPYEEEDGALAPFGRAAFGGPVDAVALRAVDDREAWRRVLVLVSRPGDSAHAMVDFATRLAGDAGTVSVCTCIDREAERRPAESRLANVVETADGPVETRVARSDLLAFVDANAGAYDLVMIGSSRDRSAASRAISPPTFERFRGLDCAVAVVDRGDPG